MKFIINQVPFSLFLKPTLTIHSVKGNNRHLREEVLSSRKLESRWKRTQKFFSRRDSYIWEPGDSFKNDQQMIVIYILHFIYIFYMEQPKYINNRIDT